MRSVGELMQEKRLQNNGEAGTQSTPTLDTGGEIKRLKIELSQLCQTCGEPVLEGCDGYGCCKSEAGDWMGCPGQYRAIRRRNVERDLWPVPPGYESASLGQLPGNASPEQCERIGKVQGALIDWLEAIANHPQRMGRSFVIGGGYGVGKTHIAMAAYRAACSLGLSTIYTTGTGLLNALRKSYNDDSETNPDAIEYSIELADLLILDDVGKEGKTDWANETMFRLLDGRYAARAAVLATTNLPSEELTRSDQWGAIIDRWRDGGIWQTLNGPGCKSLRKVASPS